jgi:hypothetical protein
VRQVLAEADDVRDPSLLQELVKQIGSPELRRWKQEAQEALLLICGEVNIVAGGGNGPARHREEAELMGLEQGALKGGMLVLNPAHTPSTLQALRDKRSWLSRSGGCVLSTANTYSGHPARNAWSGAAAWIDDVLAELVPVVTRDDDLSYTLQTITWPVTSVR